jgi:hypothetical protein
MISAISQATFHPCFLPNDPYQFWLIIKFIHANLDYDSGEKRLGGMAFFLAITGRHWEN